MGIIKSVKLYGGWYWQSQDRHPWVFAVQCLWAYSVTGMVHDDHVIVCSVFGRGSGVC